jgi:hypothetical protein
MVDKMALSHWEIAMDKYKNCMELESLYRRLALAEPKNKNEWLAAADKWHERAMQLPTFKNVSRRSRVEVSQPNSPHLQ